MVLPDGSARALPTITVRATEYTVGPDGPSAMPDVLPEASAYTYAVEFSVDEADAAGARGVRFSAPVVNYVENFLDFPVGTPVPVGWYDADAAEWKAAPDGRVVQVVRVEGGRALLDVDGSKRPSGKAALDALGVTDAELERVGALYAPGTTLWRVAGQFRS